MKSTFHPACNSCCQSRISRLARFAFAAGAVFSGAANAQFPADFPLGSLNGTNGFRLNGGKSGDVAGFSASSAGDINNDGIDDLVVGAPGHGESDSGAVFVLFGKTGGFSSPFALDTLANPQFVDGFRVTGSTYRELGFSVAGGGDVNGDGIDDLQATARGHAYVVYGKNCTGTPCIFALDWSTLNGFHGFQMDERESQEFLQQATNHAGDVNGDGVDDIVLGAPFGNTSSGDFAGRSYVVLGRGTNDFLSPNWLANLGYGNPKFNGYRMEGSQYGGKLGWSVNGAGDINGDGVDDMIIGAETENGGYGNAYVLFGRQQAFLSGVRSVTSLNGSNGFRLAGGPTERAGTSVSRAGDVNGDGYDDLIVGALFASPNGQCHRPPQRRHRRSP